MKVFSVYGYSGSGKTTTIEEIIKEMKRRDYDVSSIKDIHFEGFTMDTEGKNTWRHRQAGARIVGARGYTETSIIIPRSLSLEELLGFFTGDFLVLEGFRKENVAKVLCAENLEQIKELMDPLVVCICGKVSNQLQEYQGIPVINALENPKGLVDLVQVKAFEKNEKKQ